MTVGQFVLPPEDQVVDFGLCTEAIIISALEQNGITTGNYDLSALRVKTLSFRFLRDMYRIEHEQNGKISASKFAGYWAFWIRKIKPIGAAYDIESEHYSSKKALSEITTINEIIAVDIALNFLAHEGKGQSNGHIHDFIRYDCLKDCDGAACLRSYAQKFFEFRGNINQNYMINSMLHRTFGPHHMTMMLEHLIFGGCRSS